MKEAKPDTWMPIVIGEYKKTTDRLTRDQHGGYLLLMMAYWCTGPLLDDDEELAATVKATAAEWRKLRPKMARFFVVEGGIWRHHGLDEELTTWGAKKAQASTKGKAGANARWHGKGNARGIAGALPGDSTTPPPREVDAPTGHSTLSGRESADASAVGASPSRPWKPDDVVAAFEAAFEPGWLGSYFWPCAWQDVPVRALIPANGVAATNIRREARKILAQLNAQVLEKAA